MAPNTDSSVGSHSPSPPPLSKTESNSVKKRGSTDGGVVKVTKRRAARACVSCRARKVRCDVVEGAPCGNCRWDNVEVRGGFYGRRVLQTEFSQAFILKLADYASTKLL